MKSDLEDILSTSEILELAGQARDLLRQMEANPDPIREKDCRQSNGLPLLLETLVGYLDRIPKKDRVIFTLTELESKAALCGRCQTSATCWALCGAQGIFTRIAMLKRTSGFVPPPQQ